MQKTNASNESSASRKILMTCALPYANGAIHVGHMVEHIQADIWARFMRMQGHHVSFICADDTHGTPIMVEAKKRGITPEKLIEDSWQDHTKDFAGFGISFSHYSSTNSAENKKLCEAFFAKMKEKGQLSTTEIDQQYCEHDKMFLPDRFVKGTCPKCGTKDQYGDSCDKCGATYSPIELKEAACSICGNTPVPKKTEQLLFNVENFRSMLMEWIPKSTAKEVSNKMLEWFNEPLRPWDISRNAPYFGFEIPGYPDKFFYVWVDAPMGYVSSFEQYAKKSGLNFDEYWKSDSSTEVYHFIGKDIVYFHTLFWPSLLKTADMRLPTSIFVHGHLTVNGEKMSKSKGTQISAKSYLKHLDASYLRYFYASKLSSSVDDFDLSEEEFINRVNSELIGKITNLASRGASMLGKNFGLQLTTYDAEGAELIRIMRSKSAEIAKDFESRNFAKAMSEIRSLADLGNQYFDAKAPWKLLKENPQLTQQVLTTTVNVFRILSIFLKPVIPDYVQKVEKLLNCSEFQWDSINETLENHKINEYQHLMTRIEPEKWKTMIEENKITPTDTNKEEAKLVESKKTEDKKSSKSAENSSSPSTISIDDFTKLDLRIAKIAKAEAVPEAEKLLKLTLDLGELGTRQVFAGIKSAYTPEKLEGRLTVVVANLAPRKMKFGMSEGMVLAAGSGGSELFILSPDLGAKPGDRVK